MQLSSTTTDLLESITTYIDNRKASATSPDAIAGLASIEQFIADFNKSLLSKANFHFGAQQ